MYSIFRTPGYICILYSGFLDIFVFYIQDSWIYLYLYLGFLDILVFYIQVSWIYLYSLFRFPGYIVFYIQVSWIRKTDLHILTVGLTSYTNNQKFFPIHPEGSDEWNLRISNPGIKVYIKYCNDIKPWDKGIYKVL